LNMRSGRANYKMHSVLLESSNMLLGAHYLGAHGDCSLDPFDKYYAEKSFIHPFVEESGVVINSLRQVTPNLFPKGYSFAKYSIVGVEWVLKVEKVTEVYYRIGTSLEQSKEDSFSAIPGRGVVLHVDMRDWENKVSYPLNKPVETPVVLYLRLEKGVKAEVHITQLLMAEQCTFVTYDPEVKLNLNLIADVEWQIGGYINLEDRSALACTSWTNYKWCRQGMQGTVARSSFHVWGESLFLLAHAQLCMLLSPLSLCACDVSTQDVFNVEKNRWEESEGCSFCVEKRDLSNTQIKEKLNVLEIIAKTDFEQGVFTNVDGARSYYSYRKKRISFPHELTWFVDQLTLQIKLSEEISHRHKLIGEVLEEVLTLWELSCVPETDRKSWTYTVWENYAGLLTVEEPQCQLGLWNHTGCVENNGVELQMMNGPWLPLGPQYHKSHDMFNHFVSFDQLLHFRPSRRFMEDENDV